MSLGKILSYTNSHTEPVSKTTIKDIPRIKNWIPFSIQNLFHITIKCIRFRFSRSRVSKSWIVIFQFSNYLRPDRIHSSKFSSFISSIFGAITTISPMRIMISCIVIIYIKTLPSPSISPLYLCNNSKLSLLIKTHYSIQIFFSSFITRKTKI